MKKKMKRVKISDYIRLGIMSIIFALLFPVLFSSCKSYTDEELWIKVESAKNNNHWDSTQQLCQKILNDYPKSRYAPWARFGLAESYRYKKQPREALDNYKLFYEEHPAMQPSALSLFLVGYIYNNNLQMHDSAKFYYKLFLTRFPNHELIPSVKFELQLLEKEPNQALMDRHQQLKVIFKA